MSSIVGHFKRSWGAPSGSHGALSSRLVRLWVGPALTQNTENPITEMILTNVEVVCCRYPSLNIEKQKN